MSVYARDLTTEEGSRVQHGIRHGSDPIMLKRCQVVLSSATALASSVAFHSPSFASWASLNEPSSCDFCDPNIYSRIRCA